LIDELLTFYKYDKPVKRIFINDNNTEYIKKAFLTLEDNEKFAVLSKSAYARSVSDLIFGINMSRYFTVLNNSGTLTVGRVQTLTLGLVVNRDEEIKNHVKKKYYTYDLTAENEMKFKYQSLETDPVDEKKRITDKSFFENLDKELSNSVFTVIIEKKKENMDAPLPFNLAKLQVYCSNKFDYFSQKTQDITQSLREKHKAITYNRSDQSIFKCRKLFTGRGSFRESI
jgi:DNA topoisomerase-3